MMKQVYTYFLLVSVLVSILSCTNKESYDQASTLNWETIQDSTDIVVSTEGFSGPEAVRYDSLQDVYFVSNFNGNGGERDANGFISKVSYDGSVDSMRFMVGTETHPLHAPRGMYITGDTLWAADVDGVHGFNRLTSEQLAFIDFSGFEPGFLNDIVQAPDGHLYVTDTGKGVVYTISGKTPSLAIDSLPSPPNGITLDPSTGKIVLAPWGGGTTFHNLAPGKPGFEDFARAAGGGNFDGIEFVNGKLVAASQIDSSLHVLAGGEDQILVKTPGRPADIGIDTKRLRVAVPYIALNRVDIWELPKD